MEDISEEKLLQPGLERADCLHRDVSTTLPEDQDTAQGERHGNFLFLVC